MEHQYAGGAKQIAIEEFSFFVEYGGVDGIVKTLCTMLDKYYDCIFLAELVKQKYSKEVCVMIIFLLIIKLERGDDI